MYAVFQSNGKQYIASKGLIIRLEKLNILVGNTIEFTKVLMIVNNEIIKIGVPFINGGLITAKVINHNRDKKIKIIKFRRRKHYRKCQGHRQWFTDVQITDITSIN